MNIYSICNNCCSNFGRLVFKLSYLPQNYSKHAYKSMFPTMYYRPREKCYFDVSNSTNIDVYYLYISYIDIKSNRLIIYGLWMDCG